MEPIRKQEMLVCHIPLANLRNAAAPTFQPFGVFVWLMFSNVGNSPGLMEGRVVAVALPETVCRQLLRAS
jgi:hypothetical protein